MAAEEGKKPLARSVESLGWLASSGVQPRKRREIEGVGAASLMALQAQVAKAQQEASLVREGKLDAEELRARRKGSMATLLERKNAGVGDRDQRDRLALKTTTDRLSESRAALEKKAALYDRLARGEVDDEDDKYEVDFLMKGTGGGAWRQPELDTTGLAVHTQTGGLVSGDMARERERRSWEAEQEAEMAAEEEAERRRAERRELLNEVIDEAAEERQRASAARQQRQAAEARKRERLKAALLRKQLEQAKQQRGQQQQQQRQQEAEAQ
ncbi:hypothetical protein CHLNCDRAFT_58391 [Chlorella variabilis]|uniref:Uncharacterized protein n=1 Tax=Chlorella variabilis TaxID=554065 RepID=E1ZJV6_CHLVA|nr:hypothetical protein CHLNCDRAFT_58391 [Chlorella variabilis]EFN53927.1 hypothetical protein CHLNCDRAFT_58391 [Chlorella variabilis]|eukprot:XP_005846029.1 hypothetical protein CHLNCDRAFT_58391 [Chlorella variabilis]